MARKGATMTGLELFEKATELDAQGQPLAAIGCYLAGLTSDGPHDRWKSAYVRLAAIYYESADEGFQSAYGFDSTYELSGRYLALGVLRAAEMRYGRCELIAFWTEFVYSAYELQDLHKDVDLDRWRNLLSEFPHSDLVRFGCILYDLIPRDDSVFERLQIRYGNPVTQDERTICSYLGANPKSPN